MTTSLPCVRLAPFALLALVLPAQAQDGFLECTDVIHVLEGEVAGDQFGWVSTPIPDTNADGVQELLVGAPQHDAGGAQAGRVYLYDGRTGVELFHVDGAAAQQRLGWALRDAGDHDGDGLGDLVAGGIGQQTGTGVGTVQVLSSATGAVLLTLSSGVMGDRLGYGVTGVGDVNGDTVPDVAAGAPFDAASTGRVYVFSGADGSVLTSYVGELPGDGFGTALAKLADVTGDGRSELIVGAKDAGSNAAGKAYVYDLATGTVVFDVAAPSTGGEFGDFFVSDAGNQDGDGIPDVYVADYAHGVGRGRAYFYSGADGSLIRRITGGNGDGFGIGRPLGDLDGDGFTDFVLAAFRNGNGAPQAGRAEIYSGATGNRLRRVTSTTANENFGFDAHGLGDVDGDGAPDMVVTAATFASSRGRVYVIADRPKEPFGSGLAGTGGAEPTIDFVGCPRTGEAITIDTANVVGAAAGLLFVGPNRIDLPVFGGTLYPSLGFVVQPHTVDGASGAAGAGTASLPFTLPTNPALIGMRFHAQAAYADPGAPAGVAFTQGFRVTLY